MSTTLLNGTFDGGVMQSLACTGVMLWSCAASSDLSALTVSDTSPVCSLCALFSTFLLVITSHDLLFDLVLCYLQAARKLKGVGSPKPNAFTGLKDITLHVRTGELIGIVGPVGRCVLVLTYRIAWYLIEACELVFVCPCSGKSSVLSALLGHMVRGSGVAVLRGTLRVGTYSDYSINLLYSLGVHARVDIRVCGGCRKSLWLCRVLIHAFWLRDMFFTQVASAMLPRMRGYSMIHWRTTCCLGLTMTLTNLHGLCLFALWKLTLISYVCPRLPCVADRKYTVFKFPLILHALRYQDFFLAVYCIGTGRIIIGALYRIPVY